MGFASGINAILVNVFVKEIIPNKYWGIAGSWISMTYSIAAIMLSVVGLFF